MNRQGIYVCLVLITILFVSLIGCGGEIETTVSDPTLQSIIDGIRDGQRVELIQMDCPDNILILDKRQLRQVYQALSLLKPYDMPSPHGSGYPGYTLVAYDKDDIKIKTVELQDPLFSLDRDSMVYFENSRPLWDLVKTLLPAEAPEKDNPAYLFLATRVEVKQLFDGYTIVYDLKSQPGLSFRPASLVRTLQLASTDITSLPKGEPLLLITFWIDDKMETVEVYTNHWVWNDHAYELENLVYHIGSCITAG